MNQKELVFTKERTELNIEANITYDEYMNGNYHLGNCVANSIMAHNADVVNIFFPIYAKNMDCQEMLNAKYKLYNGKEGSFRDTSTNHYVREVYKNRFGGTEALKSNDRETLVYYKSKIDNTYKEVGRLVKLC